MSDYKDIISKNIKKYRQAANLTQVQLAKKLNITSASVSNWEKGANSIEIDKLFELCDALGISISDIIVDPEENTNNQMTPAQKELRGIYASLSEKRQADLINYAEHLFAIESYESIPEEYAGSAMRIREYAKEMFQRIQIMRSED